MSCASKNLGCNPSAVGLGHFSSPREHLVGEREVTKPLSWAGSPLELSFPEAGEKFCASRGDNEI